MTARVPVTKMHGARNDFVVLDQRRARIGDLPGFARWACDRHAGIGADGVIVIDASKIGDVRMLTINADGSEAEMCGNGIRCAARWLDEAGEGDAIRFETAAGLIQTQIVAREPEYFVRVAMGTPRVAPELLAFLDNARFVDLGNPHVVLLRNRTDAVDLALVAAGIQAEPEFANGANVHVAAYDGDDRLRVRHWERGVGFTMACGTGAVACAAAAIVNDVVESPVEVLVPGGRLIVEWDGRNGAHLTGPAERVFDTEVRAGADVAN
jgi:diaminopimelate epimerase